MTIKPLDPTIHDRVAQVMEKARYMGINITTALDRAGLLWTPEREARIRKETVDYLIREATQWMPHEYLRIVNRSLTNCTPADMYNAIMEWLRQYAEQVGDA